MYTRGFLVLVLLSLTLAAWGADDPPPSDMDVPLDLDLKTLLNQEVMVTAQRRPEKLQEVPLSMSAISGATLESLGAIKFDDVAGLIPNLSVGSGSGPGGAGNGYGVSSTRAIAIRGVAGNNTTGFYLDDTPVPMSLDPRLLDIDRIEVLRGPQGTLFGGGSIGGTVRLVTREPSMDDTSGRLEAQGSYVSHGGAGYFTRGAINIPLVANTVALRLSAFSAFDPGLYTRRWGGTQSPLSPSLPFPPGDVAAGERSNVGGGHSTGVMASLAITPGAAPGLTVVPMFSYQKQSLNGYPLADYSPDTFVQIRPLDIPESVQDTWSFAGLTLTQRTKFGRFVVYGSYLHRNAYDLEDTTDVSSLIYFGFPYYVSAPLPSRMLSRTWTGEARFESNFHGPAQFIFGVFNSLSERDYQQYWFMSGADAALGGALGTDLVYTQGTPNADRQKAVFTDVTYQLTRALQLSAGVRLASLMHEGTYTASGPFNGGDSAAYAEHEERQTAPRFTAKYQIAPNQMVYASGAQGFRIGGTNSIVPPVCEPDLDALGLANGNPFESDSIWSYEVGSKNSWFGDRLRTRLAAYRIDWNNIQQSIQLGCTYAVVANSGAAISKGAELELDAALFNHLTLRLTAGYEDAAITEANSFSSTAVGQRLQGVPQWTGSGIADYSMPMGKRMGFIRAQYSYIGSRMSFNNVAAPVGRRLPSYSVVNLIVGFKQGPWEAALSARNLFDKLAVEADLFPESIELPGRPRYFVTRPRTIGLQLQRGF